MRTHPCYILLALVACIVLSFGIATAQVGSIYDPSLGTLPDAQGFIRLDSPGAPAPIVSGGVLHQFPVPVDQVQAWQDIHTFLDFSTNPYILEAILRVISSNYIPHIGDGTQRSGYYLWAIDAFGHSVAVGIASNGITINTDAGFQPGNGVPFTPFDTTDAFHTYRLVIENGIATLFIDGRLFAATPLGGRVRADVPNRVSFGDASGLGVSETELRFFRSVTSPQQPTGPSILPSRGGNTGLVTVRLFIPGEEFTADPAVKLMRAGQPDILGTQVVHLDKETLIATFDLTRTASGPWDVVITQSNGQSRAMSAAFEIVEGGAPSLSINILGPSRVRVGRQTTFFIAARNEGLINANFVTVRGEVTSSLAGQGAVAVAAIGSPLLLGPTIVPPGGTTVVPLPFTPNSAGCHKVAAEAQEEPPGDDCEDERARVFILQGRLNLLLISLQDILNKIHDLEIEYVIHGCGFHPNTPECVTLAIEILIARAKLHLVLNEVKQAIIELEVAKLLLDLCEARQAKKLSALVPVNSTTPTSSASASANLGFCAVTSWDPNEKVGPDGVGTARYLRGVNPIPYTIFFENLATATAPAAEVVVNDQLSPDLDQSTLNLKTIRFGDTTVEFPDGIQNFTTIVDLRPTKDLLVKIDSQLIAGLLTVRLTGLDPATGQPLTDPLAGFLPPNIVPPEGEGSIFYTIAPKQVLPTGTEIRNQAQIIFDVNPPINTAEWLNSLDNTNPISQVLPLPVTQASTTFRVQWSGTDEGSGIQDYTIFVSEDEEPFTVWLSNTPDTSGMFAGQNGKTYAFYSVARDQAGHIEAPPVVPDVMTRVVAPVVGDLNGDGKIDCNDLAIVKASYGKRRGQPGFDSRADTNSDGVVNVKDLAFVAQKLPAGTRCP